MGFIYKCYYLVGANILQELVVFCSVNSNKSVKFNSNAAIGVSKEKFSRTWGYISPMNAIPFPLQ